MTDRIIILFAALLLIISGCMGDDTDGGVIIVVDTRLVGHWSNVVSLSGGGYRLKTIPSISQTRN